MHTLGRLRWQRTSGRDDARARVPKGFNDRRADAPCPARNECAAVREDGDQNSRDDFQKGDLPALKPKEESQINWTPGKFPVSRLVTTVMLSRCSAANGSLV